MHSLDHPISAASRKRVQRLSEKSTLPVSSDHTQPTQLPRIQTQHTDVQPSVVQPSRPLQAQAQSAAVTKMPMVQKISPPTDEQLLASYRAGDRTSFSRLVERYQRELFHFLIRFVGDRSAAEDIFQESFLQVHQSAAQFDPQRRFRPWLFTIAANKARDYLRSQSRRPTNQLQATISPGNDDSGEFIDLLTSADAGPDAPLERQELQRLVQKTVSEMPANFREILLLSYFHQFSYKQIGEILEIPLGTVKSRLHAAVAFFADRWRLLNQGTFDS
jgi:RNA polymerase sigma-70 factor, ECF subfamily